MRPNSRYLIQSSVKIGGIQLQPRQLLLLLLMTFQPTNGNGSSSNNAHWVNTLSHVILRLGKEQQQLSSFEASLLDSLVGLSQQSLLQSLALPPSTSPSATPPPPLSFTHPRDELVNVMSRIYRRCLTTSSGGNCSVKDVTGVVWVTPKGNDKGALQRTDIAYRERGLHAPWQGTFPPSSEWPFHTAIFEKRSDVGAVLHAHSHTLVAFSVANLLPNSYSLSQTAHLCGTVALAPYAIPGTDALADSIVSQIQWSDCVIMENHGIVVVAPTMPQAYHKFEALEFCARAELGAVTLGGRKLVLTKHDIEAQKQSQLWPLDLSASLLLRPPVTPVECDLRAALVKYIRRSYDQGLIHATSGAMSARLSPTQFLITATGVDRHCITVQDIVLVDYATEPARYFAARPHVRPSRAWAVHRSLYQSFPDTQAVLHAHPIHITSFCLSTTPFTPNVIPESFIVLRDVGRLPFRDSYVPDRVVQGFRDTNADTCNILLAENDGVIIKGTSLEQVFDRLEVLEATANVVLEAKTIGRVNVMTPQQEDEVHEQFFGSKLSRHASKRQRTSAESYRVTGPLIQYKQFPPTPKASSAAKEPPSSAKSYRVTGPLIQYKQFPSSPKPASPPPKALPRAAQSYRVTGPLIQYKQFPTSPKPIETPKKTTPAKSYRVTGPLIQYKQFPESPKPAEDASKAKATPATTSYRVTGPLIQYKKF